MTTEPQNPSETYLTITEVRQRYHFTPRMLALIKPAHVYRRDGQRHPIVLYKLSDVLAAKDSEEGKRLLAEAEEKRRIFWQSVRDRIKKEEQQEQGDNDNLQ